MEINVNLKVDEEALSASADEKKPTKFASGWVTLSGLLKFPVRVQAYMDKDGIMKYFVSYPSKKTGSGYENIVYPHDKELRAEIEQAVFEELKKELGAGPHLPIDDIKISLLTNGTGTVKTRALATIKILGMTVNGIMIKEGKYGLFVEMPQYRSKKGYEDMVYPNNRWTRENLSDLLLEAFHRERTIQAMAVFGFEYQKKADEYSALFRHKDTGEEKDLLLFYRNSSYFDNDENISRLALKYPLQPEQKAALETLLDRQLDIPVQEGAAPRGAEMKAREPETEKLLDSGEAVKQLLDALENKDRSRIMEAVRKAEWKPEHTTQNNGVVSNQEYSLSSGEYRIYATFYSNWGQKRRDDKELCASGIQLASVEGKTVKSVMQLTEQTGAWRDGRAYYEDVWAEWEGLIRQEADIPVKKAPEKAEEETLPEADAEERMDAGISAKKEKRAAERTHPDPVLSAPKL